MRFDLLRLPVAVLLLAGSLIPGKVRAQVPSVTAVAPQAAQPGTGLDVTLGGSHLAGATGLWTSFPGQAVLAPDVADNGQQQGQVTFHLTLPPDPPLGVHAIRVVTPRGISAMRLFVLDDLPSVAAEKSNTAPESAQAVTLPIAVDGTVDALGRHYYRFQVEQEETVSFEVLARRLNSPLDPVIRLLDDQGRELAYNDDAPGLMADSQLRYHFSESGTYLLELRDVQFQGSGGHHYRLRMGDFPCVTTPYPMGVRQGSLAEISFAGSDQADAQPLTVDLSSRAETRDWLPVAAQGAGNRGSGFATLAVSDAEELLEQEPNDQPEQAMPVPLGANLNGRFDRPGDVDRFVFSAEQGQRYVFTAVTRQQGSPTDLLLRLLDADGKPLAVADDDGKYDARLDFTFPADGRYSLLAEELHGRGGPEFAYRITAQPHRPGFTLAASTDTLNAPAGGTAPVTVTAARRDYDGPIEISAESLPEGLTVPATVIGPGRNSVVLTVQNTSLDAGQAAGIRLVGRAASEDPAEPVVASVAAAQQEALGNLPWPPLTLSQTLVLGTTERPAFVLRAEQPMVEVGPHSPATVTIAADRSDGFPEEIALAVTPEKDGLPEHVSVELKPIAKDAGQVEVVFAVDEQASPGEYTVVLAGTAKQGDKTTVQAVPGIRVRVLPGP